MMGKNIGRHFFIIFIFTSRFDAFFNFCFINFTCNLSLSFIYELHKKFYGQFQFFSLSKNFQYNFQFLQEFIFFLKNDNFFKHEFFKFIFVLFLFIHLFCFVDSMLHFYCFFGSRGDFLCKLFRKNSNLFSFYRFCRLQLLLFFFKLLFSMLQ